MFYTILAISSGASIGAVLRWFLGTKLNSLYPHIPLGTLSANIIGSYLIGIAIAFFATNTSLTPEWRLFIITGFLGGLTTFSTFSAEMFTLISQGKMTLTIVGMLLHVGGSILMTILGVATYALLKNKGMA